MIGPRWHDRAERAESVEIAAIVIDNRIAGFIAADDPIVISLVGLKTEKTNFMEEIQLKHVSAAAKQRRLTILNKRIRAFGCIPANEGIDVIGLMNHAGDLRRRSINRCASGYVLRP